MKKDNYFITWIGGKRLLRKRISELIPDNIGSYIEPFGGGAWVLLYKEKWANIEVYNDLDNNLYNLFNIVKYHTNEFVKEFTLMINSRKLFKEMLEYKPLTDIQKATKFFFLLQRSYSGKREQFGYVKTSKSGAVTSQQNIINRVYSTALRLNKVIIENLDFEEIFRRYDTKDAFFYLDPPYSKGHGYDVISTKDFDHKRLKSCLDNLQGRWLLSYDDSEEIRNLYKNYNIIEVSRNNVFAKNNTQYKELLIKNY